MSPPASPRQSFLRGGQHGSVGLAHQARRTGPYRGENRGTQAIRIAGRTVCGACGVVLPPARTAAVTPQTMASVLARLEGKKLISRTPSEVHAKVLLTSLTKEGEELVLQADEHARAVEQRLLDEFTQAEQEQLKDLLTRARELLRTQPKQPPTP